METRNGFPYLSSPFILFMDTRAIYTELLLVVWGHKPPSPFFEVSMHFFVDVNAQMNQNLKEKIPWSCNI